VSERKDDFWHAVSGTVAHDVNNALAGILACIDELERAGQAETESTVSELRAAAGRLRALAMDLRGLGGRREGAAPCADLGSCVRAAARLLAIPGLKDAGEASLPAGVLVLARPSELMAGALALLHALGVAAGDDSLELELSLTRGGRLSLSIVAPALDLTALELPAVPGADAAQVSARRLELDFTLFRAGGAR
jgi:hypothetical protein